MKRAALLTFIIFFLLLSGGIQILVHTCGGETTATLMPSSAEDPCGCSDSSPDGGCCTVELKTFHLDDIKQPATSGVIHAAPFTFASAIPAPDVAAAGRFEPLVAAITPSPPSAVSRTILYCSFLV